MPTFENVAVDSILGLPANQGKTVKQSGYSPVLFWFKQVLETWKGYATSALLSGVMGVCVAASNSFILIEFMGNPEYWSTTELWIFISTVFVSFLSSIVLNELKKNINDGVNNFE